MQLVVELLALIVLLVIMCILASFLWHSFKADKKGLPPYINTFRRHRSLIRDKLHIPKGSSILDLGCGDGTMLRLFVKRFQCSKAVGYDINPFAIRRGRMINKIRSAHHVALINDDIYNADISGFDYIYLYLFPDFIAQLEPWLFENIDPETIIICNTFGFVNHEPFDVIRDKYGKERIFLYKKKP